MKYFTVVNRETNKLSFRLSVGCDVEESVIDVLAKAAKRDFAIDGCVINELTPQIAREGFTIVDCITAKMTSSEKLAYTAAGRAERQSNIIKELTQYDFNITAGKPKNRLFARLKTGQELDGEATEKLRNKLNNNFATTSMTIKDFNKLLQDGFAIVGSTLVAELRERVVIDAVLRFFDCRSNEKILDSIRGVTTRAWLGHPAEHFLAVVSLAHYVIAKLLSISTK